MKDRCNWVVDGASCLPCSVSVSVCFLSCRSTLTIANRAQYRLPCTYYVNTMATDIDELVCMAGAPLSNCPRLTLQPETEKPPTPDSGVLSAVNSQQQHPALTQLALSLNPLNTTLFTQHTYWCGAPTAVLAPLL